MPCDRYSCLRVSPHVRIIQNGERRTHVPTQLLVWLTAPIAFKHTCRAYRVSNFHYAPDKHIPTNTSWWSLQHVQNDNESYAITVLRRHMRLYAIVPFRHIVSRMNMHWSNVRPCHWKQWAMALPWPLLPEEEAHDHTWTDISIPHILYCILYLGMISFWRC